MVKKLSYEYVKEHIEQEDYKLLSDTYKNNSTKLRIKCNQGHEYSTIFKVFKNGFRCPICSGNKKYTYEYVKGYIESFDYKLLSSTYINNKTKLLLKCPEGHDYKVAFKHFKYKDFRCSTCNKKFKNNVKNLTHDYDYIKDYIESNGYKLLSDTYKNNKTKLEVRCPEGHRYKTRFNDFQQGLKCPICWNESTSSKQERELQDYVESLGYDIVRNDRTQIINPLTNKNLELDIWIPNLNKAIEYNGIYWHGRLDIIKKDKIKAEQCKQKGIDLLIIQEDKWVNNNYMVKKIIKGFL